MDFKVIMSYVSLYSAYSILIAIIVKTKGESPKILSNYAFWDKIFYLKIFNLNIKYKYLKY